MVNICPRCGKVLKDSKYCDSCGGVISIAEGIQEYEECTLTDNFYKIKSKVSYEDFIFHRKTIENPQYVDEENQEIYFLKKENSKSLHQYIGDRKLELNEINTIIIRLIKIFKELAEEKLIISAINLEDFWLNGDDIESLKLFNRRRFIRNKAIVDNFDYGYSISSPEVLNKVEGKLDEESNVYIFGKLLLQLILNNFGILSDDEEMYYGYNLRLFRGDLPYKFHNFIMRCLNITKEKRFKSIKELEERYKYLIEERHNIEKAKLKVKSLGSTNVGVNKLKKALRDMHIKKYEDENEFNEDMFLVMKDEKKEVTLLALGDGVSTAKLGSGKEASSILRKNIIEAFKEKGSLLKDETNIKEFCSKVITKSNIDIIESIKTKVDIRKEPPSGIMASTLILAIVVGNRMYYTSIGDSRLFIYSEKDGLNLLNYEDNVMNLKLANGTPWDKVVNSEGRHAITRYIGGGSFKDGNLFPRKFNISIHCLELEPGEIIIICSDGVTDYINKSYYNDDLWKVTESLERIIKENKQKSLEVLNNKIITEANLNGGGDNITIITSKILK